MPFTITAHDRNILRQLAGRVAELAIHPVNRERRQAWYNFDAGAADHRTMVLAEHGGVRDKRPPLPADVLTCQDDFARRLERELRTQLYLFETLQDDHVIEPWINVRWHVTTTDYGVQPVMHTSDDDEMMTSRRWDPPLTNLDDDFKKLRPREYTVDREETYAEVEALEDVFAGLLGVRIRGAFWWTVGMTNQAINLIGLDYLMLYMFDNPDGLHRLMQFLHDDHLGYAQWLEAEGLLTLNNENDYIGSGSMGYTRDLPQADWQQGQPVRLKDLWGLLESQETVGVGPKQFAEFIYPYQQSLASHFGKVYYGCCEPVHNRWQILQDLPNLARVSVSPWADLRVMGEGCGDRIGFSRKPNPTLISTEVFDEEAIRDDLRQTLVAANGCRLEIIMKDVHTLNNQPERLPRWVALARQAIEEHQSQAVPG